ncbi:MAG: ABC transporter permease [Sphingomonadales bacterium]|jgi:phospholipid/cholesterol/gamma-HCH transport system permease protein
MTGAMDIDPSKLLIRHDKRGDEDVMHLEGPLVINTAAQVEIALANIEVKRGKKVSFCLGSVTAFDTAGAWLIYRTMRDLRFHGAIVSYENATPDQEILLEQALINDAPCTVSPPLKNSFLQQIEDVGIGTLNFLESVGSILSFFGLVIARLMRLLAKPKKLRLTSIVFHMEQVGFKALPIVGLLCFLIGLVIVQQGAFQLRQFGAEVFVVNLIGISALRELGILLTAIIAAGRSGSAFTAQIGSMKLHEEVDALETIGLDPVDTLVIPRLLALVLLLPLLTFYADVMALAGGAIWSWVALDISPATFIRRLNDAVVIKDFWVGVIKAPVFGMVIAVVGCFNGLNVSGGAESVGKHTTMSVVQSIFMVIVLDAFFAIFFTAIGW